MKLLVAISHHGLGHLAQAAPVINALAARQPELALTIWSRLDATPLRQRIKPPFAHRSSATDVGLVMFDAMHVDIAASRAAYFDFHADWPERIKREAAWLDTQGFDAVLADAAYLPLAAARLAGIRALCLCSLNWRDIAAAYLADQPGMDSVLAEITTAYEDAEVFLQPEPAMPMPWLTRRRSLPPIAARGRERREELARRLGLAHDERWILVGFGGFGYETGLPRLPGMRWLLPGGVAPTGRADLVGCAGLDLPFLDLLASCDILLTKVGYGSFVEAAARAMPVLYLDRPDWPETPYLTTWLHAHTRAIGLDAATLASPMIRQRLDALGSLAAMPAARADGAEHAAELILRSSAR